MSSPNTKRCPNPKCNGELKSNGGMGHHTYHHAAHAAHHGLQHGSPLMLLLAAGGTAMRLLNPEKFICQKCGHTVRG